MLRILLALILLSACAPSDRNLRLYNDQTGITRTVSRDTEMFRDGRDHINARAIILEKAGQTRYHLSLSVLRGGPNGPRLLALSENEKSLCYQSHDHLSTNCIDRRHKAEISAITLDQSAFLRAASDGMNIDIDGTRRNYRAQVPVYIFASALAEQAP